MSHHDETNGHQRDPWAGTCFDTRAIHVGQEPDPVAGAVVPPVPA